MIRAIATYSVFIGTLMAAPGVATETQLPPVTGLTNIGPGLAFIAIAGGIVLTLLLRPTVTSLLRLATEKIGRRRISQILWARTANVLDDFILPGAYGGLTRIDHAILTSGGIICIQTKHYNGVVFGEPNEPQWTNVDGVQRRKFLNPQIQNEGRANALRKVMPDLPVANLVVFTGSVDFTSPRAANVIHLRDLDRFIQRFEFGPSPISDWDAVWLTIKSAALTDDDSRKDFDAQLSFG